MIVDVTTMPVVRLRGKIRRKTLSLKDPVIFSFNPVRDIETMASVCFALHDITLDKYNA